MLLTIRFYLLHILLQTEPPPVEIDLPSLAAFFVALAGVAALVAALVNVGKRLGWVTDGNAPTVAGLLNVILFVAFIATRTLYPDFDFAAADVIAGVVAQILVGILGLLGQIGVSKAVNAGLRGVPLIGFSHSAGK